MTGRNNNEEWSGLAFEVTVEERSRQRDFILRHLDTVTKVLAGEEYHNHRRVPCGCPTGTPAVLAHRRNGDGLWGCIYDRIETLDSGSASCTCEDPLIGSDDPLDTVAAVILSERDGLVERYYDHSERQLVAALRESLGEWSEIANYSVDSLHYLCEEQATENTVSRHRLERLCDALDILADCSLLDGVSLRDPPSVTYERLWEILVDLPGISEADAWWLVLVAFDKPVWPADPEIDRLLLELGLLSPEDLDGANGRREDVEELLTPRQLLPLHRGLAAHAKHCQADHATASCEFQEFTLSYRKYEQQQTAEGAQVVDLFAGAGGLSHGFASTGCEITLAVDNDQYATDTYRLNHPGVPHERVRCKDIGDVAENEELLSGLKDDVDLVVGGPPCQALSVAGYRARLSDDENYSVLDDPRTELYEEYVSILEKLEPKFLVMENVEGILNEVGDTGCRVIEKVQDALDRVGYSSRAELIDCSKFGIPQDRQRVIVFGVRQSLFDDSDAIADELFDSLERYHVDEETDIRQALSNLPRIRRGQGDHVIPGRRSGRASRYVREHDLRDNTSLTYNHRAREHPMEKDRELFDEVMEPGDTGWQVKYEKGRDDLIEYDVGTQENPKFSDKYRMLHWDQPSPTIVAHLAKDANSFILPDYYQYVQPDSEKADDRRNRGITPREAARLQSFPDSYLFLGPFTSQFRQIGNAVPPVLGKTIARVLQSKLANLETETVTPESDIHSTPAATDD